MNERRPVLKSRRDGDTEIVMGPGLTVSGRL
jgi:hypothetical protein